MPWPSGRTWFPTTASRAAISGKRFVRKLRGAQRPEAAGIILTAAGEEAQVDYGSGPMVRDPQSGKYRRTRLFVLTLGYSRKSVRLLTWRSSTRIWAELHEKAFRRLGGCPRIVVLDNLKEGVLSPTSTIPPSIHCSETSSPTMAWWRCLVGSKIRIARLMFHIAPHPAFATLKVGCLARRPPRPLRIAPFFQRFI